MLTHYKYVSYLVLDASSIPVVPRQSFSDLTTQNLFKHVQRPESCKVTARVCATLPLTCAFADPEVGIQTIPQHLRVFDCSPYLRE